MKPVIPVLDIKLEGLSHSIKHCFADKNNELTQMISDSVDKQLTTAWVKEEINQQVNNCLKEVIKDLATNYRLKSVLTDLIVDNLEESLRKKDA